MVKLIQRVMMSSILLVFLLVPVSASNITSRGVLIPNDETGIVDKQLYDYLKNEAKQDQLYSNDLIDLEELTITNYDYQINSISGLRHLHMPKLKVLNLAVDTLDNINDILNFKTLEELNIYNLNMSALPERLNQLTNLKVLLIEGGSIDQLPVTLYDMISLKSLTLKKLSISEISNQIVKLMYLEELVFDHIGLKTIPAGIFQLSSLKHLEINGMKLNSLPDSLNELVKLEILHLEDNEFTTIPDVVFDLLNIQYLSLRNNKLNTINPHIQSLHRLKGLDLSKNNLQTLPIELINLPNLKTLDLANNHWDCLPPEFQYLSLSEINNIHEYYGIKVCGVVQTTPVTNVKAPVLRVQDNLIENFGFTNQEVIIESDQPVNFIVNDVANVSRDQALAFSSEGKYVVSGTNEFGVQSNMITFTIDKTRPSIKVTDNPNELGIYYFDVAIDASEDGYFIVNGSRQSTLSRLLILSEHQSYTISFVDLAGNESNVLDLILQAKAENPKSTKDDNRTWMYLVFIVLSLVMGAGTYFFLNKSVSDEE